MSSSQKKLWICLILLSVSKGNMFAATNISHHARLRIQSILGPMLSLGKAFEINVKT
jgi:hypothetical protein